MTTGTRADTDTDVLVIGAGVVGLACAAALARSGKRVVVVERHRRVGEETSSRNSCVVHGGIYYPTGSLKAELCVRGRALLYERCLARNIGHRRTGKLIVATQATEVPYLEKLAKQASANGVMLTWIDGHDLATREPMLRAHAALHLPQTGIVDVHELMSSYRAEARDYSADVVLETRVEGLSSTPGGGWRVDTASAAGERQSLTSRFVVNAAGLESDRVAALAGIDIDAAGWRIHFWKGDYFTVRPGVARPSIPLVYPVPDVGGLGIHVTADLGGRWSAGPDATFVERVHYDIDEQKASAFATSVARYLPAIRAEDLTPNYAGVRPKLSRDGSFRDFVIEESSARGAPGMVNLVGIESPGLTASGAIAERVVDLLRT